jgi:hypothetical protein
VKITYFTKHWPSSLLDDVLACVEKVFEAHYSELNQNILSLSLATTKSKVSGLKLIRQVQSDSKDDSEVDIGESTVEAV